MGHLRIVKYLFQDLNCNAEITGLTVLKQTPLHLAAQNGYLFIVSYLINEAKYDPSCIDINGMTPLHLACIGGHLNVVRWLITDAQCNPFPRDLCNLTPLAYAAKYGHVDVVKHLVAQLNCIPSFVSDALYCAIDNEHYEVAKFLAYCDDGNTRIEPGETPLHRAALHGNIKVLKYLCEVMNFDPSSSDCQTKITPLHCASISGHLSIVKYLTLEKNCTIMYKDSDGITPLHAAALHGHLEVVKFFVRDMLCDPQLKSNDQSTPLHYMLLRKAT